MNWIGTLLVVAVVSVVPLFFIFVFANSAYRSLRKLRHQMTLAEAAVRHAPSADVEQQKIELDKARAAYAERRFGFWGRIIGALGGFPRV